MFERTPKRILTGASVGVLRFVNQKAFSHNKKTFADLLAKESVCTNTIFLKQTASSAGKVNLTKTSIAGWTQFVKALIRGTTRFALSAQER
ncbi:MAG: hypothetical protein IT310_06125 [Anaerolineales bacterium]|nr:hypothetical protein [Anaerolineales bacterium]